MSTQRVRLVPGLVVGTNEDRPQRLAHRVVEADSGEIADAADVALGETALVTPLGDGQR